MRLAIFARLAVLIVMPVVLSGCGLLMAAMYPDPYDYENPPYYEPPIPSFDDMAIYNSGSATIELTDGDAQTLQLNELVAGSREFGMTTATWRGPDGWSLTLVSYDIVGEPSYPGDTTITVQRIVDKQIWVADMTWNPTACRVTTTQMTDEELTGTAKCTSLRWADGQVPQSATLTPPRYIDGQDPFGAEITFTASAKYSQTS